MELKGILIGVLVLIGMLSLSSFGGANATQIPYGFVGAYATYNVTFQQGYEGNYSYGTVKFQVEKISGENMYLKIDCKKSYWSPYEKDDLEKPFFLPAWPLSDVGKDNISEYSALDQGLKVWKLIGSSNITVPAGRYDVYIYRNTSYWGVYDIPGYEWMYVDKNTGLVIKANTTIPLTLYKMELMDTNIGVKNQSMNFALFTYIIGGVVVVVAIGIFLYKKRKNKEKLT